jgi:L-threonylcarbamoyladenylate synthase
MITKIIKINSLNPEKQKIKVGVKILKKGGILAFPTETVYGLGADFFNLDAIKRVFSAKGRPSDNPAIVHISNLEMLDNLVSEIPKEGKILIEKFWPGPLTLIFKKSKKISTEHLSGLDSIAIRMPENRIALELIKELNSPISAPSANTSGKPSPTSAEHVFHDLNGKIDGIIDGGNVEIGLESSVVDVSSFPPKLLRPGKVSLEQLKKIIPNICFTEDEKIIRSPGMKYKHYSPDAEVILASSFQEIEILIKKYKLLKKTVGLIANKNFNSDFYLKLGKNDNEIAKNLFSNLRELDRKKCEVIIVQTIKERKMGRAIMDRLKKASSKK